MLARPEQVQNYAEHVIDVFAHPSSSYAHPLSRMYCIMGRDEALMKDVVNAIKASDQPQAVKDAAAIYFKLYKKVDGGENTFRAQQHLINAINDDRMTVQHANTLYLVYHDKDFITKEPNRSSGASTFFSASKSADWQATVSMMRRIVTDKLSTELKGIKDNNQKLDFLEAAKKMPLFNEHISSYGYGRTNAVIEIDSMVVKAVEDINIDANVFKPGPLNLKL